MLEVFEQQLFSPLSPAPVGSKSWFRFKQEVSPTRVLGLNLRIGRVESGWVGAHCKSAGHLLLNFGWPGARRQKQDFSDSPACLFSFFELPCYSMINRRPNRKKKSEKNYCFAGFQNMVPNSNSKKTLCGKIQNNIYEFMKHMRIANFINCTLVYNENNKNKIIRVVRVHF